MSVVEPTQQFETGEPDPAVLAGVGEAELLALIERLEAGEQRAHLDALGSTAMPRPLNKAVKKAARKAAYRLQSRGVSSDWRPVARAALAMEEELGLVATVMPPGFLGNAYVVLARVGGAGGVMVTCDTGGKITEILAMDLTRAHLKQTVREEHAEERKAHTVHARAELALRMLEHIEEEQQVLGEPLPTGWSKVQLWREVVGERGADASGLDARARLEPLPADLPDHSVELLEHTNLGHLIPPNGFWAELGPLLDEAVESPVDMSEPDFQAHVRQIGDGAIDRWLEPGPNRDGMVRWLRATADAAVYQELDEQARQLLRLAQRLESDGEPGHAYPIFQSAVARFLDLSEAWDAYLEHRPE